MTRQVVYRLSDGLVLRYGYVDFAACPNFDPFTEAIIVSDFMFDPGPPQSIAIAWWWDGAAFTQVNPWSNVLSLNYQGVNQYVDYGSPVALQLTGPMTVSVWLQAAPQDDRIVIGKWLSAGNQRGWGIRSGQAGTADLLEVILSANGTTVAKQYRTSVAMLTSAWRHFAFTYDAGTLRLFIDGSEDMAVVRVIDNAILSIHNSTGHMVTGALIMPLAAVYTGHQDEVSMWDAALTPAQVAEIYDAGAPADLSMHSEVLSLVAWWRDGDGDAFPVLTDQVGAAHGAMTNMGAGDIVPDVP